jgi:integrase
VGVPKRAVGGIHPAAAEPAIEGEYLPATRRQRTKVATVAEPAKRRGDDRLTDADCRNAKPLGKKIRKLSDSGGMYLAVMPNGAKLWRMKYRFGPDRKERVYSIGAYPEVGLAAARDERKTAREWLRQGKDPTIERRVVKAAATAEQAITFKVVADDWLSLQDYTPKHRVAQRTKLDNYLLPYLGDLPIANVEDNPTLILETLRRIERRGTIETAHKCKRMVSQIFRYAVATGRAKDDPAKLLTGALKPPKVNHRATIEAREMPRLFKALAAVPAEINTKLALYWLILTTTRTVETRFACWDEIHDDRWRIPAARMKMRLEHVVPLSTHALHVLELAKPLRTSDDGGALLFPGFTRHGALSENALLALLARAGYFGRQTAHGFRASFSTWAHEVREADPDVIEACLAHVKEGVRGVYNRASYLSQRLELLQAWGDQCAAWGMKLP